MTSARSGAAGEYFSWGAFDPAIRGSMSKQDIVDFVLRGAKRIAHTRLAPGLREARQLSDELRAKLEWSHAFFSIPA